LEEDLKVIHKIESEVYPVPWTLNFFRIIFHINKDLFIVAINNDELIGYTVGEIEKRRTVNNPRKAGHILNIAVKSQYQGKGIGTILLNEVEKRFTEKGASVAYLEVRESNKRAQQVYNHRGYEYIRKASNYYGDEDGLIMIKKLSY
jgi:ribosomal-protein-alanine N-acetyltransferase